MKRPGDKRAVKAVRKKARHKDCPDCPYLADCQALGEESAQNRMLCEFTDADADLDPHKPTSKPGIGLVVCRNPECDNTRFVHNSHASNGQAYCRQCAGQIREHKRKFGALLAEGE